MIKKFWALITLLLLFHPTVALAQTNIEIVDLPTQVEIDREFEIAVEIAAEPSSSYYIKARAGGALNSLRAAFTFNPTSSNWLNDTSAWTKFPTINTDPSGFWNGALKVKFKETSTQGANLVVVRIRKVGTSVNLDSEAQTIDVAGKGEATESTSDPPTTNPNLKITLSEFSPAPTGGQEWVEIYNPNSQTVNISGWKIDDIEGGSSPYTIPESTTIGGRSYKVFYFSSKLNNSGDTVRLINPSGKLIEKYSYTKIDKGTVFAKDTKGQWRITTTATPGKRNKITGSQSSSDLGSIGSNSTPLGFTEGSSTGFSGAPQILGVENPNSFGEISSEPVKSQFSTSEGAPKPSLTPNIMIGLGLILLGLAFGFPSFQGISKPKESQPQGLEFGHGESN